MPGTLRRLKWSVKWLCNRHRRGGRPDILIFSTPRSGSTWLMEIIATQASIKTINEPFWMPRFEGTGGPLPPSWDLLLPHDGREETIGRYVRSLIDGSCGIGSPSPFTRHHRWRTDRAVVKILRCKDMMNWFEETFACRIVYLVRHPLPVSLSRRMAPQLEGFIASDRYCGMFLTGQQRARARSILRDGTSLERKVLDWCLQNLPPIKHLDRSRWLCVHYEDLVADPGAWIRRLASFLDLPDEATMLGQIGVPSRSTYLSDAETRAALKRGPSGAERDHLLDKWQSGISPEEEVGAMTIVREFGIDLYETGRSVPSRRL
jgi:hypothetical protein